MASPALAGSFRMLFLYDVSEEIRLEELRKILSVPPAGAREPSFRHPAPEYVRFEKPPVIEPLEPILLETGERLEGRLNYYEYGVVGIELQLGFQADWRQLVEFSSRWIAAPDIERRAAESLRRHLQRTGQALVKPYPEWLAEDYYIIQLNTLLHQDGTPVTASELIANCRDQIAQLVRGESVPLSEDEKAEILQSRMSYYPHDLLVVGWTAALVYDTPEGALPSMQLVEYANSQLLEFRHYDEALTRLLAEVYRTLQNRTGLLARWRLAQEAQRLNTIRLDVRELTERVDNSIKFLSDMFSARLYHLAAAKVGVPDYRRLVDEKLRTAGELYSFMMDQFYQGRAFVLELLIVIILLIDLVFLFRGKG